MYQTHRLHSKRIGYVRKVRRPLRKSLTGLHSWGTSGYRYCGGILFFSYAAVPVSVRWLEETRKVMLEFMLYKLWPGSRFSVAQAYQIFGGLLD
ncbi:hypothetical protein WN55_07898 [Dufourea novaeangliae]|uniref:Uncharacterized protein n=1 Tax=Dufourea novaeangliae TaxID=178035 RepID=A0A154NVV8_DUFNO|nr:hypothetical protein WN55_07898 [Dufourea novaeangliae]